jgi:hypothetical protein
VVKRARCSLRTLFERFGSLGGLGLAAFDSILAGHTSTPADDAVKADRDARIVFQVSVRARTCETWSPMWRLVMSNEGTSELLAERIEKVRALTRARLELMYRPELEALQPASRNAVLIALEALTDFSIWRRMREYQGLSVEQARAIWIEGVDRLLPPTPGP